MQSMKLTKQEKCIFFLLLILGVSVRVYRFGSAPPGLNQDEAFAAYDAWALLHYGTDSSLHRFPAYLTAWGSGMNALESYLMIPGLALFGVKAWVIRLPQLWRSARGTCCSAAGRWSRTWRRTCCSWVFASF